MPVAGCGECTMFVLTLVLVVPASCVNPPSCCLEGKGLYVALTLLFSSPFPFDRRC